MNHHTTINQAASPSPPQSSNAATGNYPLARLLQLIMLLQAERCPNARQLAEACEVSRRTIYRDFATLGAAGIAVHYVPERQGYQLGRNIFLQPTRLQEKEAIALLLISRCSDGDGAVGLVRQARAAVDKVLQGLPQELRASLGNVSELLAERPETEGFGEASQIIFEGVLAAMTRRRQIRLWYHELGRMDSEVETTKMSLYRLARLQERWALVGRSSAHRSVVMVPLLWIEKLEATTDSYTLPPRFQLKRFLDQAHGRSRRAGDAREIVLKLRGGLSRQLELLPWKGHRRMISTGRDVAELAVEVESLEGLAPVLLSYGDDLEVIGPEELRAAVGGLAARIARKYGEAEASASSNFDVLGPSGGVGG